MKEILLSVGFILFVVVGMTFIYSLCIAASKSDYYLEEDDDNLSC